MHIFLSLVGYFVDNNEQLVLIKVHCVDHTPKIIKQWFTITNFYSYLHDSQKTSSPNTIVNESCYTANKNRSILHDPDLRELDVHHIGTKTQSYQRQKLEKQS